MAEASRTYGDTTAGGQARLHMGDVRNNYSFNYNIHRRRSDETLQETQRNNVLLTAAAEGQTPRVKYLLQLGAQLDHSDDRGLTALHHAALSGFRGTTETLIEAGADVNAQALDCGTPLHLACLKERVSVVKLLLKYRASVRKPSRLLGSALHCAQYAGNEEISQLLCDSGADEDDLSLAFPSLMDSISITGDCVPKLVMDTDPEADKLTRLLKQYFIKASPFYLAVARSYVPSKDMNKLTRCIPCKLWIGSCLDDERLCRGTAFMKFEDPLLFVIYFDLEKYLAWYLRNTHDQDIRTPSGENIADHALQWSGLRCLETLRDHRSRRSDYFQSERMVEDSQSGASEAVTADSSLDLDRELAPRPSRDDLNGLALQPVHFKGMLSVSATVNKPISDIRSDIIRALRSLEEPFEEVKAGFKCESSRARGWYEEGFRCVRLQIVLVKTRPYGNWYGIRFKRSSKGVIRGAGAHWYKNLENRVLAAVNGVEDMSGSRAAGPSRPKKPAYR